MTELCAGCRRPLADDALWARYYAGERLDAESAARCWGRGRCAIERDDVLRDVETIARLRGLLGEVAGREVLLIADGMEPYTHVLHVPDVLWSRVLEETKP